MNIVRLNATHILGIDSFRHHPGRGGKTIEIIQENDKTIVRLADNHSVNEEI